jgi:hypothetical protein
MCDSALALATCSAPQGRLAATGQTPGFAQLCYDAARIVTVDTLTPIGKKLACLFQSSGPGASSTVQCTGGPGRKPTAGTGGPIASPVEDCGTVGTAPAVDGAHAVRDILSFLQQVEAHPKAWCGQGAANADDRRLYMRAFVHRVYDYRCQYQRALAPVGAGDELAAPGPDGETRRTELAAHEGEIAKASAGIFGACGIDVPAFATDAWSAACNGPIPKTIP